MNEREITDRLYGPWELRIESWADFQAITSELATAYPQTTMVWRGARRAEWGVMSSLYRKLTEVLGTVPTESQLVASEQRILHHARRDWRFDHLPALEIFAHLQHFGGPTRLLDVTYNPMIALWFATESRPKDDGEDARLFAFTSGAREIHLNSRWYGRYPYWHSLETDASRVTAKWGTGQQRRIWRPPAFNERIASQNAAFVIDGAPLPAGSGPKIAPEHAERWSTEDLRLVSSINFRPSRLGTNVETPGYAPVFTMRISAGAKVELRDHLGRHGLRASSIYSDMSGLATFLDSRPEQLLGGR